MGYQGMKTCAGIDASTCVVGPSGLSGVAFTMRKENHFIVRHPKVTRKAHGSEIVCVRIGRARRTILAFDRLSGTHPRVEMKGSRVGPSHLAWQAWQLKIIKKILSEGRF